MTLTLEVNQAELRIESRLQPQCKRFKSGLGALIHIGGDRAGLNPG